MRSVGTRECAISHAYLDAMNESTSTIIPAFCKQKLSYPLPGLRPMLLQRLDLSGPLPSVLLPHHSNDL